jgi:two-component system chemotaxis sensor kinase CheA
MDLDNEELIRTFIAETDEQVVQMEEVLVALECAPNDTGLLATLFRLAHTLKGNCSVLDLAAPEELAHVLEGLLERMRGGTLPVSSPLVTLLLEARDVLRRVILLALNGHTSLSTADRGFVERLQAVAEGRLDLVDTRVASMAPSPEIVLHGPTRTLRVDVGKLDRMLDLTGEVAIARGRLLSRLEALGPAGAGAMEAAREMERLGHALQELITTARMVPVGSTFHRYVRTVRDLAAETGRRARLVIEGEEVEVDTAVIERLCDPLTHMIRNAVHHGIEPPEVRSRAGKDLCGTITLRAFHQAGCVVVEVADDGAGLDTERILARGRERGLVSGGERLSEAEVHRLIFEPGFSTAETVTLISGRGVGMDVVRRNIDALRGTIAIASRPGQGTTFTIRLPLTLAVIDGLAVGVSGETYILPIDSVVECVELHEIGERRSDPEGLMALRGETLPYLRLSRLFDAEPAGAGREFVVVARHGQTRVGLAVDALLGESQAVIKPLDAVFRRLPGISGSTILGDGRVALILDVPLLVGAVLARNEAAA